MRALVNKLPVGEASDYGAVKERVLLELKLSPADYRRLFLKATKMEKESWTQDSLPVDMQTYVTLNETGKWLKPAEVAALADRFEEGERCKQRNNSAYAKNRESEKKRGSSPVGKKHDKQSIYQDINVNQNGTRADLRRVEVKCGPRMVQAVIDSGAEISVVRKGVAPEMKGSAGRVTLTGAFGDSVSAVLRHIPMTLSTSYVVYAPREVPLLCAVTEQLVNGIDMLLTPDDYDSLKLACGRVDLKPMVVLVVFNKDRLKMLATTVDGVGPHDFGMVLLRYFVQEFKERYMLDVATNWRALMRLITECERLKKQMGTNPHDWPLNIECFKNDRDVAGKMKRKTFETMCTDLLARAERTMAWALTVAGLRPPDVKSVKLVGSGIRALAVKQLVRKLFQR
ncbi:heat shock 70 kDa protein cognate 2-like [Ixodes scapularis]|uniref:heat shock 70 kDa protein cognate 2-like n=1 Tax=Ixodes scapularis TaxID=6945 RepID=UPI001A9FD21C|nr:heat shock 70 kDa protein cognate 2-like [Ixodes scapularis]